MSVFNLEGCSAEQVQAAGCEGCRPKVASFAICSGAMAKVPASPTKTRSRHHLCTRLGWWQKGTGHSAAIAKDCIISDWWRLFLGQQLRIASPVYLCEGARFVDSAQHAGHSTAQHSLLHPAPSSTGDDGRSLLPLLLLLPLPVSVLTPQAAPLRRAPPYHGEL